MSLGKQATVQTVVGDLYTWGVGVGLAFLLFVVGVVLAAPKIHAKQERRFADLQRRGEQRVTELQQQIEGMRAKRLSIIYSENDGVYLSDIPVGPVSVRLFRVGVRNDSEHTIDDLGLNLSGDPEWATAIIIAERPIPLKVTDSSGPLNPGTVRLFDVALIRRISLVSEENAIDLCVATGFSPATVPLGTYGITLTAHGRDVSPTTARALIQTTPGDVSARDIVFRAFRLSAADGRRS